MELFNRLRYLYSNTLTQLTLPLLILIVVIVPFCSNAVKNTNNDGTVNAKVGTLNRASSSVDYTRKNNEDDDIVGFGEDCSSEGPFCDEARHLTCDPVYETCICDVKAGYVHINDVPGGMEQHLLIQRDENGNHYLDLNGNVCISKQEIIERTEELLGLGLGRQDDHGLDDMDNIMGDYKNGQRAPSLSPPSKKKGFWGAGGSKNTYDIFLKNLRGLEQPDYDEERLQQFKLRREPIPAATTEKELIIEEILKYRKRAASLDELKPFIIHRLNSNFKWRSQKLSNSICSRFFNIDRDEVLTHQDYVITIFSENIRDLVIPKVFLNLIGPLIEESCVSKEDLWKLDHDPKTFDADFSALDVNGDGCFSQEEFRKYLNQTCRLNWFSDFLRETDLEIFLEILDPTPEEMYIRKLMQNSRMTFHWEMVDVDNDGFLSIEELHADIVGFSTTDDADEHSDASLLMKHLDKNGDGKASLEEVKTQISTPDFTEEYQFDWLESLYELYETDDEEVNEYLEIIQTSYKKQSLHDEFIEKEENLYETTSNNRLFTIFDKDENGQMDEVEFKLLMEMLKKYVVYDILNDTVDSMDLDSDRKLSIFEYQEFFKNASSTFRIYFKNLLALEDEVVEHNNGNGNSDLDDSEYYGAGDYDDDNNYEEEETDAADEDPEVATTTVSSTKLSKRAATSNETLMVYKLFIRLDENSDGFITKEDFYSTASSFKATKTHSEIREDFAQLDVDNDGVLTTADSEDYVIPIDLNKFIETADVFSEEVFSTDMKAQFFLLDANMDGVIQEKEFQANKKTIVTSEEEGELIAWIEVYLDTKSRHYDVAAGKAFAEFDRNCDGVIMEAEFTAKVEELQQKSKSLKILGLKENISLYFKRLDLNKDNKISHNEFQLLLLRTGKKLNEL